MWLHGRSYWSYLSLRDGDRKRVSLGTGDKQTAKAIEGMLAQLKKQREWDLLELAGGEFGVGRLYDCWREGEEALAQLRSSLADVDLQGYVAPWQAWLVRDKKSRPETVARYLQQLRALMPEGQRFPCSEFTKGKLLEAQDAVSATGSTRRRYRAAWSSFARYLAARDVIDVNPLPSVEAPKENPVVEVWLPEVDVRRLVDAQGGAYRPLFALLEGAGAEISAALKVCRRDFNGAQQTVHLRGTKNVSRDRWAFVEDWAWAILWPWAKGRLPDAPLFVDEDGVHIPYHRAHRCHQATVKRLGLRADYTMHDARHSLAVRWRKKGIKDQVIANNLGHRNTLMVQKLYGKFTSGEEDFEQLRKALVS